MTGIERLYEVVRELGRFSFCYDLYETLGNIADQIERERECDADTIENLRLELGEARDEAAWVREHGGLDSVRAEWRSRVPHDRYERRRQRLLGHIAECESALGRRRRRIEELEHERGELYEMARRLNAQTEKLTHAKPEPPDSWERLEEDAEKDPCGYFGFDGEETCGKCPASGKNCEQTMAQDLVRRCRALAERSE